MKKPDPDCKYCGGTGEVRPYEYVGRWLPCSCTNEREPDKPAVGKERLV